MFQLSSNFCRGTVSSKNQFDTESKLTIWLENTDKFIFTRLGSGIVTLPSVRNEWEWNWWFLLMSQGNDDLSEDLSSRVSEVLKAFCWIYMFTQLLNTSSWTVNVFKSTHTHQQDPFIFSWCSWVSQSQLCLAV